MGVGKVQDVDIVANSGPIPRVVIVTENREVRTLAKRHLNRQRDGVSLRLVPLADASFRVRAGGVEIAHHRALEPDIAIVVGQGLLDHQLAAAIGVERGLRMILGHREMHGVPEGRAGGREHHSVYACTACCFDQRYRSADIVVEERAGVLDGLAHLDAGGEVQNRHRGMGGEHRVQPRAVADIAHFQRAPLYMLTMTIGEVVVHHGPKARRSQR